ncbi:MAG: transglutaminase domain-containing protein, partial [Planctomycetaceae bacterium]
YELVEGETADHFGPRVISGLSVEQIERQLRETAHHDWQIERYKFAVAQDIEFAHEDPARPRVEEFRKATADLWPKPFDVFEVARRVRKLTRHETDFDSGDVVACLTAARSGRGLLCQHFSRLFGCVCSARGYTTRVVSLSEDGNVFDHAMCEIYLPDYGRWVVIDTDFGVAYRLDGKWLNAVEVQRIWRRLASESEFQSSTRPVAEKQAMVLRHSGLEMVTFGTVESQLRKKRMNESRTGMNLELFEYVFIAMRDDNVGVEYPFGHPVKVKQLCFAADGSDDFVPACPEAGFPDYEDVYWHVGACGIQVTGVSMESGLSKLSLAFSTRTPRFAEFECRVGGGDWRSCASTFDWVLESQQNRIDVRSINTSGVRGPVSTLRVRKELAD